MANAEGIILFGASQHAAYAVDIIEAQGIYTIRGIIDENLPQGSDFAGYPVLGNDAFFQVNCQSLGLNQGLVCIGDNYVRTKVARKISETNPAFEFVTAVHPSVVLGKWSSLGQGTLIMAGAIVGTNTSVGDHCFIATNASIDHDSILGNGSSISAASVVGGGCHIGSGTSITMGCIVLHKVSVGDNSVIGSGALVNKNIPNNVVAYGSPARIIRSREAHDSYL